MHHHMLDLHRLSLKEGLQSRWAPAPSKPPPVDAAVLFMPRSKPRVRFLAAAAAECVSRGGHLVLAGPKRSGTASMAGDLERHFGPVVDSVRVRGCAALLARREGGREPFSGERVFAFDAPSRKRLKAVSLPGVFSHGRLDPGTALLLGHLEDAPFRRALDWGCGCGVIGAFLAASMPEGRVDMVDIDVMAVESSRRTLALNGLSNARVSGSVGLDDIDGTWDLIVSNPPFHRGAERDPGPAESLLEGAPSRLRSGGRLVLVANSFLPYERVLRGTFGRVRSLFESGGYKVLEARAI